MDFNECLLEHEVRDRLAAARDAAYRRAQRPARRRRPLRVELGAALIALGQWLGAPAPAADRSRA